MQAQCMTWLFAYFDVSWVVHGGARSQVPCSGSDAMEVRRGQGHMQASLNQAIEHDGIKKSRWTSCFARYIVLLCVPALIQGISNLDLGSTIGR